jgi:hypothetical protein
VSGDKEGAQKNKKTDQHAWFLLVLNVAAIKPRPEDRDSSYCRFLFIMELGQA